MKEQKEIKFSLVYRDMWQSSGKYQPRKDQLERIAPLIIDMGCFSRVETNGGAFEQVNLLYGENPNKSVRAFTKPFNEAGIQTHMLDRGLNALRMYPVPADVRRLMYKVKKAQGVDITRIFDGLNDTRNIIPSIKYALEAGMIPQATLCITYSPVHTEEYYFNMANELIEAGAPEISLKDMAGIGRPAFLGRLVKMIKDRHPNVLVQYHGHSGPGFSVASMLEVCRNGADIIDVAMEPISWGKIHPDLITVQQMLRDAGFKVPDINMNAYMKARAMTQEFIDDFLGYFMDPSNKQTTSLLVGCGLPGGMMGSMMADLKGVHAGINMFLRQNNKPELSIDDLLVKLFEEVEYVWPKLGYPPLVTPFSQYVKNVALMNVYNIIRGEGRWQAIDQNVWGMILGKSGRLPGKLDPEIIALAKEKGYEFTHEDPQTFYPDQLDEYRKEMDENGWDYGQDDEELFELAMHDRQYRDYKSGVAKERFEADLIKAKEAKLSGKAGDEDELEKAKRQLAEITEKIQSSRAEFEKLKDVKRVYWQPVTATINGIVLWEISSEGPSSDPQMGKEYSRGEHMCYIESPIGFSENIKSNFHGRLMDILCHQGAYVKKGDVIAYIDPMDGDGEVILEEIPKIKRVENTVLEPRRGQV